MKRELPEGYIVKYHHERDMHLPWLNLSAKGGRTIARVFDDQGNFVAEGIAECRPDENFNKKLGRRIALGRALAILDGTIEERERRQRLKAFAATF